MRRVVEVAPAKAFEERRRLFSVLSEAMSVDFRAPGSDHVPSGRVLIDQPVESLGLPTLWLGPGKGDPVAASTIRFSESEQTPIPFRGWSITNDQLAGVRSLRATSGARVLGEASDLPVWTTERRGEFRLDRAVLIPDDLDNSSPLLSRWSPNNFFDLLPLIEFTRSIGAEPWSRPPLLASLIIDDPNLRSMRYGYLDFGWLAEQSFHTSISTIPLDCWYINSDVAELFRSNRETISLFVHGNNHTRNELQDITDEARRLRIMAQALRRVRSAGAQAGITVDEVMSAPHGRCSEQSSKDMAMLGFESLCINEPIPWLDTPSGAEPLTGWFPADTSSWTPVLQRVNILETRESLPLRAYLGQPLLVYGHQWDLADQSDIFGSWAADIERLGDVRWTSVGSISRQAYSWRTEGDSTIVRPHTRVIELALDGTVNSLRIEPPDRDGYEIVEIGSGDRWERYPRSEAKLVPESGASLTVRLLSSAAISADVVPNPSWRPWPLVRRILTEARDRSQPFRDSLSTAASRIRSTKEPMGSEYRAIT